MGKPSMILMFFSLVCVLAMERLLFMKKCLQDQLLEIKCHHHGL
jgi:hypothetical protein